MPAPVSPLPAPATPLPAVELPPSGPAPRSPWWRFALLVVLLGAAAGSLLLWSPTALLNDGLADRMPGYWFAPLFATVYAVGTLAFVPGRR